MERKGAYYTVSDLDHPITKLMQSPYKVPRGSNVLVSLSTREVLAQMSQINEQSFREHIFQFKLKAFSSRLKRFIVTLVMSLKPQLVVTML